MSQSGVHTSEAAPIPIGVGPRTGSDPNNSAQEVAVLRAELRGLEGILLERAAALSKALETTSREFERRMFDRADALDKALTLQAADYERRIVDRWDNHFREHRLIATAVEKAEASVNLRLEGMNELRAQITSERAEYVTRPVFDANQRDKMMQITSNSDKLIQLTAELSGLREDLGALKSGQEWLVRLLAGAVITAVIGVLFTLIRGMP